MKKESYWPPAKVAAIPPALGSCVTFTPACQCYRRKRDTKGTIGGQEISFPYIADTTCVLRDVTHTILSSGQQTHTTLNVLPTQLVKKTGHAAEVKGVSFEKSKHC